MVSMGDVATPAITDVAWSSAGVLILLIGVLVLVWRPYARSHRIVLGLGALTLAGLPFTPGGLLAGILASGSGGTLGAIAGGTGLLGMATMAVRLGLLL